MKTLPQIKIDKDVAEKTKLAYLENYRRKFPFIKESRRSFHYFAFGFASGIALILIISGSAVYANQTNVGADSLLYPMKRIYESIDLGLSGKTEKSLLQVEFADRRLKEIEDITKKSPENPKVTNLLKDLENSVKDSMTSLSTSTPDVSTLSSTTQTNQQINVPAPPAETPTTTAATEPEQPETDNKNNKTAICKSLSDLFGHDSPYLGTVVRGNPDFLKKFGNNCEPLIGEEEIKKIYEKQQENIRRAEELDRKDSNSGSNGAVKGEERKRNSND